MSKEWYNHENMLNMLKLKTLPNQSKSLILGSVDSLSSNFNIFEKNTNCLTLQAVTCKFSEMCPFCVSKFFFFILTLHTIKTIIWLTTHINSDLQIHAQDVQWPIEKKMTCSWFTRKLLIAKILERCLSVARKIPCKSQLTLDPCHHPFIP